ncbi:hypothetical protein DFQ30_003456 [Apophysomyces sp. BC1015]|nr:hypothetical protein DFQ30_003456 [Apophysomyces sp. BC1015]KAG0180331.1 hypothetical protein DFQ29_000857 [Apophysomyces sp. BC1021]
MSPSNDHDDSLLRDSADLDRSGAIEEQKAFEANLAKAIELSLKETETTSQKCPVCDVALDVSVKLFEIHVDQCLLVSSSEKDESQGTESKKAQASSWSSIIKTSSSNSSKGYRQKNARYPGREIDTRLTVDAFNYGKIPDCDGYFLSHFHSDHYQGLTKGWSHGPIYCSTITANLVHQQLGVSRDFLRPLAMDKEIPINDHVTVGLIDANHCPGSVLFFFKILRRDGVVVRHLHTGDFRANPRMCLHPLVHQQPIHNLYLDTTYLSPEYPFPAQEECIEAACNVVRNHIKTGNVSHSNNRNKLDWWLKSKSTASSVSLGPCADKSNNPLATATENVNVSKGKHVDISPGKADTGTKQSRVLVVVGAYTIGKEKIFHKIAKLLDSKIYVTEEKQAILRCQENEELASMLTKDQKKAQVHVLKLHHLRAEYLYAYVKKLEPHFTSVVAFRPTGWTFKASSAQQFNMSKCSLDDIIAPPSDRTLILKPQYSSAMVKLYGVPYSEHSSFRELGAFIASLDIQRIIPTVNMGSEKSRQKMAGFYNRWQEEKKKKGKVQIVPFPVIDHW